ncbi:MAG: putative rane protein [Nocardioides sp.]|nr:putative rane protein [Nocardioides sp.]
MEIGINVIGWTGTVLLVGAYGMLTANRLSGTGALFQLMNLVGGLFLMLNSAYYGAWPSVGLNVVWLAIGIVGLLRASSAAAEPVPGPRVGD